MTRKGESELSLSFPAPWSRVLRATRALLLSISLMHQSNPTVPIVPPGPLRGICLPYQSWGWGISKFCVVRGSRIYLRRGRLRAFDTQVVSFPDVANHGGFYWKHKQIGRLADWLIYQGREKRVQVFSGMYSRFYACICSLLITTELTLRKRELSTYVNGRFFY